MFSNHYKKILVSLKRCGTFYSKLFVSDQKKPNLEQIAKWQKRWLVLKGAKLLYFKKDTDKKEKGGITLDSNSKVLVADRFEKKATDSQASAHTSQNRSEVEKPNCFKFVTGQRTWYFSTFNPFDRDEWVEAIRHNLSYFSRTSGGINTALVPASKTSSNLGRYSPTAVPKSDIAKKHQSQTNLRPTLNRQPSTTVSGLSADRYRNEIQNRVQTSKNSSPSSLLPPLARGSSKAIPQHKKNWQNFTAKQIAAEMPIGMAGLMFNKIFPDHQIWILNLSYSDIIYGIGDHNIPPDLTNDTEAANWIKSKLESNPTTISILKTFNFTSHTYSHYEIDTKKGLGVQVGYVLSSKVFQSPLSLRKKKGISGSQLGTFEKITVVPPEDQQSRKAKPFTRTNSAQESNHNIKGEKKSDNKNSKRDDKKERKDEKKTDKKDVKKNDESEPHNHQKEDNHSGIPARPSKSNSFAVENLITSCHEQK